MDLRWLESPAWRKSITHAEQHTKVACQVAVCQGVVIAFEPKHDWSRVPVPSDRESRPSLKALWVSTCGEMPWPLCQATQHVRAERSVQQPYRSQVRHGMHIRTCEHATHGRYSLMVSWSGGAGSSPGGRLARARLISGSQADGMGGTSAAWSTSRVS